MTKPNEVLLQMVEITCVGCDGHEMTKEIGVILETEGDKSRIRVVRDAKGKVGVER